MMSSRSGRRASGSATPRSASRLASVANDDDDRAVPHRHVDVDGERRVVAEDRPLELLQLRARLDSELVDEHRSRFAVSLERLRLAAARIQRPHQRRA